MTTYQKQARNQTEALIADYEKQIIAAYQEAKKQIDAEISKLYEKYLTGISPEDYYNTVIQFERLAKAQAQVTAIFNEYARQADKDIIKASTVAMNDAYYKNQFVIDWFAPLSDINMSFTALPKELAAISVTGNWENWRKVESAKRKAIQSVFGNVRKYVPKQGGTIMELLLANRREVLRKINATIASGIIQGNSYTKTATAVKNVIGKVGKDEVTGAMSKALRIVRTESNRTYNAGAFANSQQAAAQGLNIRRMWLATLDSRTRDRHASLDGAKVGVDEAFPGGAMYPGNFASASMNIHCRCSVIDTVDGIPPKARRGVNPETGESEIFDWQTYDEWAKQAG